MAFVKEGRRFIGLRRTSKILTEGESSEVASDEECESTSASEDVPMNLNDPLMDEEWQSFKEETRSGRIDVEEMPSGAVGNDIVIEEYHGAAIIIGKGQNLYSRIIAADEHHDQRKIAGPFYPFSGQEDWEMYKWLSSLRGPMEKIDEFFKLPYVCFSLLYQWPSIYSSAGKATSIVFFIFKRDESARRTSSCYSSLEASRDQGSRSNHQGAADALLS